MTTRDRLINLIKQHTQEEYDNIIDEPYYWINEGDIGPLADAIMKSGLIKEDLSFIRATSIANKWAPRLYVVDRILYDEEGGAYTVIDLRKANEKKKYGKESAAIAYAKYLYDTYRKKLNRDDIIICMHEEQVAVN